MGYSSSGAMIPETVLNLRSEEKMMRGKQKKTETT